MIYAYAGGAVVLLAVVAFYAVPSVRAWFKDSEIILGARIQAALGAVWGALLVMDWSPIIPPAWMPYYLLAMGIVTEVARRYRAEDV